MQEFWNALTSIGKQSMNEIKGYLYSEKILKDKDEGPQTWRSFFEYHFLHNSLFQLG